MVPQVYESSSCWDLWLGIDQRSKGPSEWSSSRDVVGPRKWMDLLQAFDRLVSWFFNMRKRREKTGDFLQNHLESGTSRRKKLWYLQFPSISLLKNHGICPLISVQDIFHLYCRVVSSKYTGHLPLSSIFLWILTHLLKTPENPIFCHWFPLPSDFWTWKALLSNQHHLFLVHEAVFDGCSLYHLVCHMLNHHEIHHLGSWNWLERSMPGWAGLLGESMALSVVVVQW